VAVDVASLLAHTEGVRCPSRRRRGWSPWLASRGAVVWARSGKRPWVQEGCLVGAGQMKVAPSVGGRRKLAGDEELRRRRPAHGEEGFPRCKTT
jgi:hypothetical protein